MHPVLNQNLFLVKEHVGFFKLAKNFDIFDPNTQQKIMECREPKIGPFAKMFRLTDYRRHTPFHIEVTTPEGEPVLSVNRRTTILRSMVKVLDDHEEKIGGFRQRLISIGGAFDVLGRDDQPLCVLKGKWTSWEFRFLAGENELARVTKKWAGLGKELFTTADTYMIEISDQVPPDNPVRQLIVGAVLCIDLVLKE